MTSQFDSLLDFGDSTPAENGTNQDLDNFDPFGPSPTIDVKGTASGDLLGDFSFDSQISPEQSSSNGKLNSASNLNPLYELSLSSSDKMEDIESVSPVQDMKTADSIETQKQEIQMSSAGSTNPLYDFMTNEGTNGHSEDLLGTGTSDDSGVTMEAATTEDVNVINTDVKEENGIEEYDGPELDEVNENGIQDDQDLVSIEQESSDENAIENIEKAAEREESLSPKATNNEDMLMFTQGDQVTGNQSLVDEDVPIQDSNIMTTEQILMDESAGNLIGPLDIADESGNQGVQEKEEEEEIQKSESELEQEPEPQPEPEPEPEPEPTLIDTEFTQEPTEEQSMAEENVQEELVSVETNVVEDQPEAEEVTEEVQEEVPQAQQLEEEEQDVQVESEVMEETKEESEVIQLKFD